jgi:hypothetical protein
MTRRRRRSDRSGRAPLFSPGRPPVAGREVHRQFWAAIATGMASVDAAVHAGMSQPVGARLFREAGGMLPAPRRRRTVAGHPPAHRRPSHLRLTAHHRARLNRARSASGVETRQPQACLPPHAPGAPAAAAHVVLRLMRAHEGQRYCLGVQPALVVRCAGGRLLERRGGPHPSRSTPATERSSPGTLRPAGSAARWCVT